MSRAFCFGLPVSLGLLSQELQKAFSRRSRVIYRLSSESREAARLQGHQRPHLVHNPGVESWELVILDSPIVQRLREIRHFGLAGLVYPAAGYSRFEHTLGTLYQAQRVIESINRNAGFIAHSSDRTFEQPISRMDEVALRLAALLHDVGHCFLSHVSERALERLTLNNGSPMKSGSPGCHGILSRGKIPRCRRGIVGADDSPA